MKPFHNSTPQYLTRAAATSVFVALAFGACAMIDDEIEDDSDDTLGIDEAATYSFSSGLHETMNALGCETHASGDLGVCFTRYDLSSDDARIFRLLEYLLDTADSGTDVKISIYHWKKGTDSQLDRALFETKARSVQFVIDEAPHNQPVVTHLVDSKGYQLCGDVDNDDNHSDFVPCTAHKWVQTCVEGCANHGSTKASQHTKLFLFRNHPELVGNHDDLVVVTSANVVSGALRNSQNAMVLASEDSSGSLFRWAKSRFGQMARHEWAPAGKEAWTGKLYPGGPDVYGFWTHAPNGFDAWEHIAERISNASGDEEIRVAMSSWNPDRSGFGSRLDSLARRSGANYSVELVVDDADRRERLRARLRHIPDANIQYGANTPAHGVVHDKFLALAGRYEGLTSKYVFSGSHVMILSALRSEDMIVGVRSSWLYNRFVRHFNTLTP